ncbi:MAG: ribosome silencing factor [Candidatus Shikimatogenerans sp. JK-2022]|nr:ribosome silencing factor [Candidatus Shikimatogenerans bostrichidophilus]
MIIYKKYYFFIKNIINNINLIKGNNVKIIDIRKQVNNLFSFFIICEGISNLHIKTIYYKIILSINKDYNINPYNIEGINNYNWVLIDYKFLIVNIFLKKIRYYYNIDTLFKKYPVINIT